MPTQPPLRMSDPADSVWCPAAMRTWIGIAFIITAVILAWANSVSAPFELDDESSIVTNASVRDLASFRWLTPPATAGETVSGRPVLNLSFAMNYAIGGLDVHGYHITNITIHILAALTLFGVARRTLLLSKAAIRYRSAATSIACATSAVWAVHPLQTEAVTYIVQRAESLAGLFYLLTLYSFIRSLETSTKALRWTIGSVLACFLGMMTKETVVTAPIVVLLYHRAFVAGSFATAWRSRWRTYVAFACVTIALGMLVLLNANRGGSAGLGSSIPVWSYLLTQCTAIVRYCSLAYWPTHQVFDYGMRTVSGMHEVAPKLLLLCSVGGATIWLLWRNHVAGFLAACFFLALAPSSSFVPVATQTIAEHRMYLALAPLIFLTALGVRSTMRWPIVSGLGVILLVISLGSATFARNRVYISSLSLWQDTVTKAPYNARAHNNLGCAFLNEGRVDEAIAEYQHAIELQPNHAFAHFNLGNALVTQRRWSEAAEHFSTALAADPHYANARMNLGLALMQLGRRTEAANQFRDILHDDNGAQDARTNLASLLIAGGEVEEGMTLLRDVVAVDPGLSLAHYHLGLGLEKMGQVDAAENEFRETIRLKPNFAEAHLALGNIALGRGNIAPAETSYREAIRLDSNSAEAIYALGNVLAQQQQFEAAMTSYRQALVVDPAHIQARNNLANCQLVTGRFPEAIANYEEVLRLQPQDETVRRNLEIAREQWRQPPK